MKRLTVLMSLAVALVAATALAGPLGYVDLNFQSAIGSGVTMYYPGGPASGEPTVTAPYGFTLSAPSNPGTYPPVANAAAAGLYGAKTGFCVDLTQTINYIPYYDFAVYPVATAPLNTVNGATANSDILKLITEYQNTGRNIDSPDQSDQTSALTLAIWEVLSDTTPTDVTSGNVHVGAGQLSGAASIANTWLVPATLAATTPYNGNVYALVDLTYQDQMVGLVTSLSLQTPEPRGWVGLSSLCLLGLPIGIVAIYRRRRQFGVATA